MENQLKELMKKSGILWFLKAREEQNIIIHSRFYGKDKILMILDLYDKQVIQIKNFQDEFIECLEKLLILVNSNSKVYFKNITYAGIDYNGCYYNNTILLYTNTNPQIEAGFLKHNGILKITKPIKREPDKIEEIKKLGTNFEKLLALINENKFSIRGLMAGYNINQAKATNLFNYLKLLGLFEINEKNPNEKHFDNELLKTDFITEEIINKFLNGEL